MSAEPCAVVRDFRPEDREAAIAVLAASFEGFGPADQVTGVDDKAPARRRRMFEMTLKKGANQNVIVAECDGRIDGVLTYADRPDCIPTTRDSFAAVRIAGPRLLALIRAFREVDKAHPKTPHRHLPVLGVHPEAQGLGIGGLLMSEYARRCDEAGLEGYLETTRWADPSRRAQERLYERHGFVEAEVVPMTNDWSMVSMKRPAGTGRGASAWWSWTPAVSEMIVVETCELDAPSTMISLVGIWTGASLDTLDQAPDQVVNSCRYGTSITLPVEAGQTYRVAVDSAYYGTVPGDRLGLPLEMEGSVPLTIRAVDVPANDAFEARQVLQGPLPLTVTATNVDATGESAEPGHDFLDMFDSPRRSVWYEWTASATGRVMVESCDGPTDVVIGLYEGAGLGEITDLEGFELQTCPAGFRHPIEALAGSTYLSAVDGVGGSHGPFSLTIRDARPPANDQIANAQVLSGALPIIAAGSTVDATIETGEPDHGVRPGRHGFPFTPSGTAGRSAPTSAWSSTRARRPSTRASSSLPAPIWRPRAR